MPRTHLLAGIFVLAIVATGSATAIGSPPVNWGPWNFGRLPFSSSPTTGIRYPKYNEVYGKATHNSYWFNRNHSLDAFGSGTEELLSDQFLHEHIRAIEIDVHT